MRLAAASDVVALLGLQGNTGSEDTAKAALDVVTTLIEEHIDSVLKSGTYEDYFSFSQSKYSSYTPVRLRLTAGFLKPDEEVVIRQSTDGSPLADASAGSEYSVLNYTVDSKNGIITLLRQPASNGINNLVVQYKAGFDNADDQLNDENAPEWLESAAKLFAQRVIRMNPSNVAGKKIASYAEVQAALHDILSLSLNPHIRPRMEMLSPDRSVAEYD